MSPAADFNPIEEATLRQLEAASPEIAAFVSAHAGSGKTHVLTGRVIRLLLEGVDPQRILCLTYTRAAAAEMKTRIFRRLSHWIDLDDDGLRQAIYDITGGSLRFDEMDSLVRARQLFARALETPGGLKVQTIHAFCERLLKAFPVEAGLPPGFEVLDEKGAHELITEARHMVLAGTAPIEEDRLARLKDDLTVLSLRLREESLDELLNELLAHRHRLQPFLENRSLVDAWRQVLDAKLGLDETTGAGADAARLRETWWDQVRGKREALEALCVHLDAYRQKTNTRLQGQLAALLSLVDDENVRACWDLSSDLFLTQKGQPRQRLLTADVIADHQELVDALFDLRDRFHDFVEQERGRVVRDANLALLNTGLAVMETYAALKQRMGVVDYDDLIARTLLLLDPERGDAAWVLYRLDGGIEHVLVDEAQDTSPQQWQIIKRLTEEFCAGSGRYEAKSGHLPRTVFAVGDYKQSIYSFQGAEPEVFRKMEAYYHSCFAAAGLSFKSVEMSVSFRSAPVILKAVDAVLSQLDPPLIARSGGAQGRHCSAWGDAPGIVEMWLPEVVQSRKRRTLWHPPSSLHVRENARMRLARRMAQTIHQLISERVPVREGPKTYRPVRYGDVLILLRSRSDFMETIISVLKQSGIPVAGADRLKLPDYLAVQDMLALLRFLANREDDLALACVLKSPLLKRDDDRSFDDDDLIVLSQRGRAEETSLWQRLQKAAQAGHPYAQAVAQLRSWWSEAGFLSPFAFLARVLGRDEGRRRFIERLGEEAAEPLDALLDMARAYEMEHGGAPAGFADWLEMAAPEIRRETDTDDSRRDEVRVMTVHGAKGLEASVVFLPDTCEDPLNKKKQKIIHVPIEESGEQKAEIPFWVLSEGDRNERSTRMFDDWQQRQLSEHHRLLYVAMTRARDRLYIAAAPSVGLRKEDSDASEEKQAMRIIESLPPQSWYRIVQQALFPEGADSPHVVHDQNGRLTGWRMETGGKIHSMESEDEESVSEDVLPEWVRRPVMQPLSREWLAPSRALRPAGEEEDSTEAVHMGEKVLSPLQEGRKKQAWLFGRGRNIHRLLELLPEIEPEEREERALAWLQRPPRALSRQEAQEIWTEVKRLLEDPALAALFGPEGRAEVPFAARIQTSEGMRLVAGQIDRLAVKEREVIVADYKTMRPPPENIDVVPEEHIQQLALYAEAMRHLWPERTVRALLVYTAGPEVMEIPRERLRVA